MKSKRFFVRILTVLVMLGVFFFFFFGFVKPQFQSAVRNVNRVQLAGVQRGVAPAVMPGKVSNVSVVVNGVSVVEVGVSATTW